MVQSYSGTCLSRSNCFFGNEDETDEKAVSV